MAAVARVNIVSSASVVWENKGTDAAEARLVANLHKVGKHWEKGSVKMDNLPAFALDLHKGEHMLIFDAKGGYRHLRHPLKMQGVIVPPRHCSDACGPQRD